MHDVWDVGCAGRPESLTFSSSHPLHSSHYILSHLLSSRAPELESFRALERQSSSRLGISSSSRGSFSLPRSLPLKLPTTMLMTPSKRRTASDSHPRPATLAALHAMHAPQSDTSRSHSHSHSLSSHPNPHPHPHSAPYPQTQDAPPNPHRAHDTAPPPSAASSPPATLLCTPGDDCVCVWDSEGERDAEREAARDPYLNLDPQSKAHTQPQAMQGGQDKPQLATPALELQLHLHPPSCSDSDSDPEPEHCGVSGVDLASRIEAWRLALAPPAPTALKRNKAYVSLHALVDADGVSDQYVVVC